MINRFYIIFKICYNNKLPINIQMTNNTTTKKTYHIGNPIAHDAKASKTNLQFETANLNKSQIAAHLGISKQLFSAWYKGGDPKLSMLLVASKTTGKSLDEVYQFLKPFFEKRK